MSDEAAESAPAGDEVPVRNTGLIPQPHGGALRAPWKKGESGNPLGRKTFGAVAEEWYNAMSAYTRPELEKISEDQDEPAAKVAAAKQIIDAMNGKLAAMIEACDRTGGQTVARGRNETHVILSTPADRAAEAASFSDRLRRILGPSGN